MSSTACVLPRSYSLGPVPACSSTNRISSTSPGPISSAVLKDHVVHGRSFSTPDPHRPRRAFATVLGHRAGALQAGEAAFGISWRLIMSFLRHLSEEAVRHLAEATPHLARLHGVGLDLGSRQPPSKFARSLPMPGNWGCLWWPPSGGGPADYIWQASGSSGATHRSRGALRRIPRC